MSSVGLVIKLRGMVDAYAEKRYGDTSGSSLNLEEVSQLILDSFQNPRCICFRFWQFLVHFYLLRIENNYIGCSSLQRGDFHIVDIGTTVCEYPIQP